MSCVDTRELVGEQVRKPRESRLIRALLTGQNGMPQDIFIRNLSRSGVGARASTVAPARGEIVSILLPGQLAVSGVIRWRAGQHFGVELDEELKTEIVSEEMRRQATAQVPESNWEVRRLHRVITPQADASKLRPV